MDQTQLLAFVAPAWRPRLSSRRLACFAAVLAVLYLIGLSRAWGDLAVAAAVVAARVRFAGPRQCSPLRAWFSLAFPPYAWPLVYLAASAPLFALWRYGVGDDRYWWLEAFMAGLAMAWLAAPFLGGAVGDHHRWVHLIACSLIGMQMIPVAAVIRFTRPWPAPTAASRRPGPLLRRRRRG